MRNLLPGTEVSERMRFTAGPSVMIQRCPVCYADVDIFIMYNHLLKADFEWALLTQPWGEVRQYDYMMFSNSLEPCGHVIIVPDKIPVCKILQTCIDDKFGPPVLVLWPDEAKKPM